MSPESESRLAGSNRYQGRRHLEKCVSFYISLTVYFTTKGVETFFIHIKFSIFFVHDFFCNINIFKIYKTIIYLQNYHFEYLLNRLLFRENTYDQTCRASNFLHIVIETSCSIINTFKGVLHLLRGAPRNLHKMYSISS